MELRVMTGLLARPLPSVVGPELIEIYNDSYRAAMGDQPPTPVLLGGHKHARG
ncbi:hypothetical protein [Deinococcus cavernae]|uniref:hypothetical protein n=1 Tax=Deinococcus cavernae TaxID=2320857 RepID=UPI001314B08A|nr:hypothetical protein [Deinococcus cavernae]